MAVLIRRTADHKPVDPREIERLHQEITETNARVAALETRMREIDAALRVATDAGELLVYKHVIGYVCPASAGTT